MRNKSRMNSWQTRLRITKSRLRKMVIIVMILILFILSPQFQVLKSYSIMFVYSKIHEKNSFLQEENIDIHMKGGLSTTERDYYPFVMTYDTTKEFSKVKNEAINLVVLYNFGYMEWLKGASVLYDESSPYYSTFYGMYIASVKDKSRQFGLFDSGDLNIDEIMNVTDFDLKELVLDSLGNFKGIVNYNLTNKESMDIVEIDGLSFQVLNADIEMNSMWHEYKKNYMAYLQYGTPSKYESTKESFALIKAYGRIYIYFDREKKVSYFGYIIATNKQVLEETEKKFILTTTIH